MFVEKYPDKRSYFELSNEIMKFSFPTPGPLEGVKSRSKIVLRMNSVDVQYPTKVKPTVMDVSPTVGQCSRVAVIGANGAGKTTAIKIRWRSDAFQGQHLEGPRSSHGVGCATRFPLLGETHELHSNAVHHVALCR